MLLATAEEMRRLDQAAIRDYSIPSILLMENAGRSVVSAMAKRYGALAGKTVTILAGPGNNGGDGLVIARHLTQQRALVNIILMSREDACTGDARVNLDMVRAMGLPLHVVPDSWQDTALQKLCDRSFCLVDALFGTGLTREITGRFAAAIQAMNSSCAPVVAVDIPSGLDADQGRVLGTCVRADLTVALGLAKVGMALYPGRELCGEVIVADISIPRQVVEAASLSHHLLDRDTLALLPPRPANGHKGTFGHLLLVAGSRGKTGAALLAAQGALRSGVGLVSMAAPEQLLPIYATALPEAMTLPLPGTATHLTGEHFPIISDSLGDKKALVIGPGMGVRGDTGELVDRLYRECPLPMVVDADGLNLLDATKKNMPAGVRVLTPHPGEMSRLCSLTTQEVQQNRIGCARDLAHRLGAVVALKGAATVVASPDGKVAVNTSGNPAMATGGTGDVLAGVIGSFLAQGLLAWEAACLGVFVHGRAGDLAAGGSGRGMTASECAAFLPQAMCPHQDSPGTPSRIFR